MVRILSGLCNYVYMVCIELLTYDWLMRQYLMKWLVRLKHCMKKSEGCSTMFCKHIRDQIRNFWLKWEVFCLEKENAAFQHQSLIPSVKPGYGRVVGWPRSTASGQGRFVTLLMEQWGFKWNSEGKCHTYFCYLPLKRTWVMQKHNFPH